MDATNVTSSVIASSSLLATAMTTYKHNCKMKQNVLLTGWLLQQYILCEHCIKSHWRHWHQLSSISWIIGFQSLANQNTPHGVMMSNSFRILWQINASVGVTCVSWPAESYQACAWFSKSYHWASLLLPTATHWTGWGLLPWFIVISYQIISQCGFAAFSKAVFKSRMTKVKLCMMYIG